MKENAQRILSWLYPADRASRWVAVSELPLVVPELTEGGLHSVLGYLKDRRRIVLERVEGIQAASITTHGMRALEGEIPAFAPARRAWKGEWQGIFFLNAPAGDKQFRFLRRLLVDSFAVPLARGMFLYPGELPEKIIFELRNGYEGSVSVIGCKQWQFGDEKEVMGHVLHWGDLMSAYSSVSKEIDRLLTTRIPLNSLNYQQKFHFSSVFSRLFSVLVSDFGLQKYYFPQVDSGMELLFSLHTLSTLEQR